MVTPSNNPHMCLEARIPAVPSLRLWSVGREHRTKKSSPKIETELYWILDMMASFPVFVYILTFLIICKTDKKATFPLTRQK